MLYIPSCLIMPSFEFWTLLVILLFRQQPWSHFIFIYVFIMFLFHLLYFYFTWLCFYFIFYISISLDLSFYFILNFLFIQINNLIIIASTTRASPILIPARAFSTLIIITATTRSFYICSTTGAILIFITSISIASFCLAIFSFLISMGNGCFNAILILYYK